MENLRALLFVYAGVVLLNAVVAVALWLSYKKSQFRTLFAFWGTFFVSFMLQGVFQQGTLPIVLAYSSYILPVFFIVKILNEGTGVEYPSKRYWAVSLSSVLVSVAAGLSGASFFWVSLAPTITMSFFLIKEALVLLRKESGVVSRMYGAFLILNAIHFLDYPFLRPNPDFALLGFSLALVFVVAYSILLPAFVVEKVAGEYSATLEEEVAERTKENKALVSILSHDISNISLVLSMSVRSLFNELEKPISDSAKIDKLEARLTKATSGIEEILTHVKEMQAVEEGKRELQLEAIDPAEVVGDIIKLHAGKLEEKNVRPIFLNGLPEGTKVMAEMRSVKNQVLSNFVSNAIKFSFRDSEIHLILKEVDEQVVLTIRDKGMGMEPQHAEKIFSFDMATTSKGTEGEKGTGFGLPIAKKYLDFYGADIKVESVPKEEGVSNHGTSFFLYFEKAA